MKIKKKIIFFVQFNNYVSIMVDIVNIEKSFTNNKSKLKRFNKCNMKVVCNTYA